jgi:hypothetical protein
MKGNAGIAVRIAEYLRANQDERGTIFDVIDNEFTPLGQYGITFYALSAFLIYRNTGDAGWYESGSRAISFYLDNAEADVERADRGHKEFNDLAILKIFELLKSFDSAEALGRKVESYVRGRIPDVADLKVRIPNNWMSMRAACCAIKSKLFPGGPDNEGRWLFEKYVLGVQLKDGFFYDCPPVTGLERAETPLVYHAKICAMLAMGYEVYGSAEMLRALLRGLDVFAEFIAPDGECCYYGRTNNGVFGYAGAVYAYQRTAGYLADGDRRKARYAGISNLLSGWIKKWQLPDGHVAIAPNSHESEKMGWDVYMHGTVYNAYTAAMLLLAGDLGPSGTFSDGKGLFHALDAGLMKLGRNNRFHVMSTRGQDVEDPGIYGRARYKGLNILKMLRDGGDVFSPPEINDSDGHEDFFIEDNGGRRLTGSNTFSDVEVIDDGGLLAVIGGWRMVLNSPEFPSGPGPVRSGPLGRGLNRLIESKMPRRILPWAYSTSYKIRGLNRSFRKDVHGCLKAIAIDSANDRILFLYYISDIKDIRKIGFPLTPPVLDSFSSFSTGYMHSSVRNGGDSTFRRTLKTSKGPATQEYLTINAVEDMGAFRAVSVISFMPDPDCSEFLGNVLFEDGRMKLSEKIAVDFPRRRKRLIQV